MAPLTKRSKSDEIPQSKNPSLPEHILDHMILPRLSFKALKRFQCVSKKYRTLMGHDPLFPSDQARLLSPSSTDLVHLSKSGLTFLINPASVGVPDPSLKFLGILPTYRQLLCSTNGLLLLYGSFEDSKSELCLCNPATQEKVFVPTCKRYLYLRNMGLAFEPSITPNRYILVNTHIERAMDRFHYRFYLFRSDTGEWSRSNQKVPVDKPYNYEKTVHMQGVIYWQFYNCILWYNTEKDLAGSVPLPTTEGYWSMGVYAGGVVCCRTWYSGVEVWRLMNGNHWNRLHCIHWDSVPLQLDPTWWKTTSRLFLPLAFDGQFVYLLDFLNQEVDTDRGAYTEILGYNLCTQQLEQKGGIVTARFTPHEEVYDYHNSMAPLPKIL